jgi:hypothetical protein
MVIRLDPVDPAAYGRCMDISDITATGPEVTDVDDDLEEFEFAPLIPTGDFHEEEKMIMMNHVACR